MKIVVSAVLLVIVLALGMLVRGESRPKESVLMPLLFRDTIKKEKATAWPVSFGFGHQATVLDIAALDIDVRPDGKGLPPGNGNVVTGKAIYIKKCALCHGETGEFTPGVKLPAPALVSDTGLAARKVNTIGNYWPYASTVFDYIRRAMPYNNAGSLTDDEVYAVTAYLLHANKIIAGNVVLNARNLPKIVMPAQKYFINDDRKGGAEIK